MVLLRLCAGQGPWPSLQPGWRTDLLLDWVPSESQGKLDFYITGPWWASWRCCWLCDRSSGYQRKGGPHPVLSGCRDLYPGGRREASPQSSRVFLSNPPVWAVSSLTLEQVPCPWLTFHSVQTHRAAHLGGHPVGNRWLLVPVPGPRACLTLLHGSRSESGASACYLPLLEKDYFFPAQQQLENRKRTMSFLEVTDYPQLATPEVISVLPVLEPSPSASAGPLGQHSGFSWPVWQVHIGVCYYGLINIQQRSHHPGTCKNFF